MHQMISWFFLFFKGVTELLKKNLLLNFWCVFALHSTNVTLTTGEPQLNNGA